MDGTCSSAQQDDGAFPFDPAGRHYRKDDFIVATTFLEPMGHARGHSLRHHGVAGARAALPEQKPPKNPSLPTLLGKRSTTVWTCSAPKVATFGRRRLHSPNLLAAGHAAVAYYLGHRHFGDERYLAKVTSTGCAPCYLLPTCGNLPRPPRSTTPSPACARATGTLPTGYATTCSGRCLETFALSRSLRHRLENGRPRHRLASLPTGRHHGGATLAARGMTRKPGCRTTYQIRSHCSNRVCWICVLPTPTTA